LLFNTTLCHGSQLGLARRADLRNTMLREFLKRLLWVIVALASTIALIEGSSSLALVLHEMVAASRRPAAEWVHTRYDPELGWVALPNLRLPDLYGPGVYLRSNSRGFRNAEEFEGPPPPHKLRVICAGDSFTLGYGVDNDHTWCQRLEALDDRLQTVNMGQGGYGVDQAYLWYRRDGLPVDHQILLFTFVTYDFDRVQHASFLGHGKPVLRMRDGELAVENVPAPPRVHDFAWLIRNRQLFSELRTLKLANGLLGRIAPGWTAQQQPPSDEARRVAAAIFATLRQLTQEKNVTLALVYLPTEPDYLGRPLTEAWRSFVADESLRRDIPFVDLVEDFRKMRGDPKRLFIQRDAVEPEQTPGHYTEEGN
jgi:hypothetical protein